MSMNRGLSGALAIASLLVVSTAAAQQGETGGGPEAATPDEGPQAASTSVVVDEQEADLERMQREAEAQGQPDSAEQVAEPEEAAEPEESLHHGDQAELRVGIGVPYVFAVKYGDGPKCDADGAETFCRRLGSTLLDLELGFGVSRSVELSILGRFGLVDDDAAQSKPLEFGFGARAYGAPDPMVKLFFGGRVMVDVTSSDTPEWNGIDVGLRGELGLQVDIVRYTGLYLQLGETLAFLRGLYFKTDVTGGAQFRFP